MRTAAALICTGIALICAGTATAGDGGSGTYIVTGQTYDFDLLNTGTTPWQYFELVGPVGTTFVGGATIGEITARCVTGQPDGGTNEIECGPISAAGLAPNTRVGFVATVNAAPACGAQFQLDVSSTGVLPYTPADTVTFAGSCVPVPPPTLGPTTVRGTPVVGARLVATPPTGNEEPTRLSYQWQRCERTGCRAIKGATKLTLLLTANDAGDTVRIVTTATFDTATLTSDSRKIAVRIRPPRAR
jgi:hypothetical protein